MKTQAKRLGRSKAYSIKKKRAGSQGPWAEYQHRPHVARQSWLILGSLRTNAKKLGVWKPASKIFTQDWAACLRFTVASFLDRMVSVTRIKLAYHRG